MTTDTALIEKREELKRRLAAAEYRTLVDVVFDGISRFVQKITRRSQPISPWFGSLILCLAIILLQYTVGQFVGDLSKVQRLTDLLPTFFVPIAILISYSAVASMVVGNIYVHRIFTTYRINVLNAVESLMTLDNIEKWLSDVCNRKTHLIFSIVGGGLLAYYLNFVTYSALRSDVPSATALGTTLISICITVFLYLVVHIVLLAYQIGRYHLNLYKIDPGSSEVVSLLSSLLNSFVYLVSIYAAFLTLAMTSVIPSEFYRAGFVIVSLFWIPIIAMFILSQSSLSAVIRRAKWKTLNELQARVEKLHTSENLGEKETMEAVNRFMDYHDRINTTRNSALDLRAILNFVNSLLLPLLAFLLANLDLVLKLFGRNP